MTSSERSLHRSDYYAIDAIAGGKVVRVTRSARAFGSEEELNDACWPVQRALDAYGREGHALLIDTRRAAGRNDAAFEEWFAYHRRTMILGFARVAILCSTTIGMMHARRLATEDGNGHARAFTDEDEALAYLTG